MRLLFGPDSQFASIFERLLLSESVGRLDIRNPGAIFLRPGSGLPKRDQEWTNLVVELARFIDMRRESPI
jgi:hypothetical protein